MVTILLNSGSVSASSPYNCRDQETQLVGLQASKE